MHKLAMILSAAQSDDLIITYDHMIKAYHTLTGIEADMLDVLNNIGKVESSKHMDIVHAVLRVRGHCPRQDLWRACLNSMNGKEFSEAITGLIEAGYAAIRNDAGSVHIWPTKKAEEEERAAAIEAALRMDEENAALMGNNEAAE